jgi:integrase/recombinase XerD
MKSISTTIMLDSRRALKDGTYPVKLRVTYQRKRKYFHTAYNFSVENFEKMNSKRPGRELKKCLLDLQGQEQKANDIIDKLPNFSFYEFEKRMLQNSSKDEVFSAYDDVIARLEREDRVGTASNYGSARASLWSFWHKKPIVKRKGVSMKDVAALMEEMKQCTPLPFSTITKEFLEDYEKWLLEAGRSITTVGIYLRTLRALFNEAVSTGDVNPELYPFGKRKYQIPSGVNTKKALTLTDIKKIFEYEPIKVSEAYNRDLWLFSYLCNGINVKDIAKLRYKQIDKESLRFIRVKTARSTRPKQKSIIAVLTPEVQHIIDRWGNTLETPETYVFPILSQGLTPKQDQARVRQATKGINKYMKKIIATVGLDEKNVTTYTARHSFATILKRQGIDTAFISEALGHTSEKTTQHYLDTFEDETRRKVISKLTAFDD